MSVFWNSVYLSVCRRCLSIYSASTAYTSLCRGLKYLLKVRYTIPNYPNVVKFLIFETLCLGRAYVWKKFHKNERHLSLVTHTFTKLSQNVCLINKHILVYWHARYNCRLWKALWFYCVSSPNFHRLCVWLMYTFWNVNMPIVTAGYGRFSDSIAFFVYFSYVWNDISSSNFYKLYVKAEV